MLLRVGGGPVQIAPGRPGSLGRAKRPVGALRCLKEHPKAVLLTWRVRKAGRRQRDFAKKSPAFACRAAPGRRQRDFAKKSPTFVCRAAPGRRQRACLSKCSVVAPAPPNALLRPRALAQISPWRAGASPREGPLFLAYARADLASSSPKPAIRNNRDRRSRGPTAPSGGTHCVFYCQPIPKQLLPGAQAEKPRSAANRAHRARESPPPHAARATRQSS